MKKTNQSIGFIATIAIITLTLALTACDNGNNPDPNGNGDPDPKTVNIAPEGANIAIYNHTSAPNADMLALAEELVLIHDTMIISWETYPDQCPAGYEQYAAYGNNIIVILSDTAQKSQKNGQTLTIYFSMAAYIQGGSDAIISHDLLLAGTAFDNIEGNPAQPPFADLFSYRATFDGQEALKTRVESTYNAIWTANPTLIIRLKDAVAVKGDPIELGYSSSAVFSVLYTPEAGRITLRWPDGVEVTDTELTAAFEAAIAAAADNYLVDG